jgi:GMP synthase-like glutamine amidotransferase
MNTTNHKPVVIFRFLGHEGPGYLGDFLDEQKIAWTMIKVDKGAPIPASILAYSGMVLMGGPMSVNDDLPWIAPILDLIRTAKARDIPVIGHCLGGQLMSKALGAEVYLNPVKEIGWSDVQVSNNPTAQQWFGDISQFNAFHWHGETFGVPTGATHLLASQYCQNQAWSMGKLLAFQTHIEMTPEMVVKWCAEGADEIAQSQHSPAVQTVTSMLQHHTRDCLALNQVAKQVYTQWVQGLVLK